MRIFRAAVITACYWTSVLFPDRIHRLEAPGSGQGFAPHRAFRPIIMTSLAFTFGVLPLVLATGAGAEMRHSLGTAVFSGMIGVTLFGIFLTPVFYYVLVWLGTPRQAGSGSEPAPRPQDAGHPREM
jgi:hypothetical protein